MKQTSEYVSENKGASIDQLIEKANNSMSVENTEEMKQRSALLDLFMKVTAQGAKNQAQLLQQPKEPKITNKQRSLSLKPGSLSTLLTFGLYKSQQANGGEAQESQIPLKKYEQGLNTTLN